MEKNQMATAILEKMKAPAAARMFKQGVVLQSFDNGYLHSLSPDQEIEIKRLEAKGALVYHVIHEVYRFCDNSIVEMETYLLIGKEDSESCLNQSDLEEYLNHLEVKGAGRWDVFTYVKNLSYPDCSEYGYSHVQANGNVGISRVS